MFGGEIQLRPGAPTDSLEIINNDIYIARVEATLITRDFVKWLIEDPGILNDSLKNHHPGIEKGKTTHLFFHFLNSYVWHPEAQEHMKNWILENRALLAEVHVLSRSKFLLRVVTVVSALLDIKTLLLKDEPISLTGYGSEVDFERKIRGAIRDSQARNPFGIIDRKQ